MAKDPTDLEGHNIALHEIADIMAGANLPDGARTERPIESLNNAMGVRTLEEMADDLDAVAAAVRAGGLSTLP